MNIYIALSLVIIIPFVVITLLPQNKNFFQKDSVIGFGLGVYAALIVLLLKEGSEHSLSNTLLWFIVGLITSILIGYFFKHFHHHHSTTEHNHHSKIDSIKILVSDFFHNIVDGMAIISACATNPFTAVTTLLGITGHQTIQQVGQQVLLIETNIQPKKALLISFVVSLSLFLGFTFSGNETIEHIFIALSAGIICWKVITDITHTKWNSKSVYGFMIGAVLLTASLVLVPHAH